MRTILYIGNKLEHNSSKNVSTIQILGSALEGEGFHVIYASSKSNKLQRLCDMIWTCLKARKKVDYVLIDTYSTQNFYYALIISQICRLFKLDYIPILHGGNLEKRLKENPKFSQLIFSHAKWNVAPSVFIKDVFESYGYVNIKFIPNALNIENYPFTERASGKIKLLWVRSFSNIYNPILALKVVKVLLEKGFEAELCMVGPDTGDGSFKKVKELSESWHIPVTFTGKLSKKKWTELSKDYNVFLNTTNFDNMPVSIIEAMALGLPVISTNVGGMPHLIEHGKNGLLVPKNDAMAFVKAILELRSNTELQEKLVFNARKKVENFDWKVIRLKWQETLT